VASGHVTIDLVGLIYDAAGDSTRWPAFSSNCAQRPLCGRQLLYFEPPSRSGRHRWTVGVDRACSFLRALLQDAEHLPDSGNGDSLLGASAGVSCHARSEARPTELYNDFCTPEAVFHRLNAVTSATDGGEHGWRDPHAGAEPYGDAISRLFEACCLTCSEPFSSTSGLRGSKPRVRLEPTSSTAGPWRRPARQRRGRVVLMNRSAERNPEAKRRAEP